MVAKCSSHSNQLQPIMYKSGFNKVNADWLLRVTAHCMLLSSMFTELGFVSTPGFTIDNMNKTRTIYHQMNERMTVENAKKKYNGCFPQSMLFIMQCGKKR